MNRQRAEEYLVRRIAPGERFDSLLAFPRYFEIETIHACNARCAMCTIGQWKERRGRMDQALFERLASEIIGHSDVVRRVSLYRDGEPLLDPTIHEKVAMMKQGGVREVLLSSNASLLDEEKAENLLRAGLDEIIFSVDSLDPEVYAGIRRGLDFHTVMDNVQGFIALRDCLNPDTRIRMRMILQQTNHDEWPAYQSYWQQRLTPRDRICFNYINNWGGQLDNFAPEAMSYEPNLPCVALFSLLVIFADGRVPYCNVDFNNSRPTGDLNRAGIAELWQGEVMHRRRERHLSGDKGHNPMCAACNAWDEPPDGENISAEYAEPVVMKGGEAMQEAEIMKGDER